MMAYVPQEIFFQYFAVLFFTLSLFVPKKRDISNGWLAAILAYALFHTILLKFDPPTRLHLMNMFLGLVTFKIIAERIDVEPKIWGKAFIGFCILNIVWITFQYFNQDPLFSPIEPDKKATVDMVGLLGAHYALGCAAALMAPFIYAVHPACLIFVVPLLMAGKSSTAVLAAVVSILFIIWNENRKLFLVLVVLGIVGTVIYTIYYDMPTGQFGKRMKIWQYGFHYLAGTDLWRGLGLGSWHTTGFMMRKQNGEPEWWSWAHNEYLQYAFEQGVFGFMLLTGYIVSLFKRTVRQCYNSKYGLAAFISLLAISVFHFPFRIGRLAVVAIVIVAITEANKRTLNEKDTELCGIN
jgi:hypothetical protein